MPLDSFFNHLHVIHQALLMVGAGFAAAMAGWAIATYMEPKE